LKEENHGTRGDRSWIRLVQVCRRLRNIVFASPRRLNVLLSCTIRTLARDILSVWPPLPMYISDRSTRRLQLDGARNIVTALRYRDRIGAITSRTASWPYWEEIMGAMQEPFPALTSLCFWFLDIWPSQNVGSGLPLPDSLFGGSAPRATKSQFGERLISGNMETTFDHQPASLST